MKKNVPESQKTTKTQKTASNSLMEKKSVDSRHHLESDNQQKEIEKLAYQLYLERGCHPGRDKEDWLKAEGIIKEKKVAKR